MTITKQCKKCSIEKPATEEYFSPQQSSKDKLATWCRICKSEYNKERYIKNSDKIKQNAKNWQTKNPEKTREIKRNWKRKTDGFNKLQKL